MTFLITLIALLAERFLHWHHLRHWNWFLKYEQWISQHTLRFPVSLRLVVDLLPPLLVIWLIDQLLSGWLYGVLEFAFGVAVLLYCLGPENLWAQTYRCIEDLKKGDKDAISADAKSAFGVTEAPGTQAFHKALVGAIFVASHQRIFAVIFWFVLLGPVGAVLYRLAEMLSLRDEFGVVDQATMLRKGLDWLPVRLFSFIFALGGHFTQVLSCWKKNLMNGLNANDEILVNCGLAALDVMEGDQIPETGEAEVEALELLDRVFVMGLVLLAFVVMLV